MRARRIEGDEVKGRKAILFDLDGVLYVGEDAVPGAVEAVRWARERGIPHLFVTNTTSKPRVAIVEKLRGLGLEISIDELLTPPVAAADWLRAAGREPVALFVPDATQPELGALRRVGDDAEEGAAAVVVGDLGEGWSFAALNRAFRLLMARADCVLVALGTSRFWRAADGLRLDAGPYVKALEYASGRDAIVLGKPDPAFFGAALSQLGVRAEETVMIGDDVIGDVAGAKSVGLAGVLVRTGKFRPEDLSRGVEPDAVLGSIAELPQLWSRP